MSNRRRSKNLRVLGVGAAAATIEAIVSSFGNSAFAETGGFYNDVELNVTTNNLCVPEGQEYVINSSTVPSSYPAIATLTGSPSSAFENFYITELSFSDANSTSGPESFTITNLLSTLNGYPGSPSQPAPGISSVNAPFSFTAPSISFDDYSVAYEVYFAAIARDNFFDDNWGDSAPISLIESDSDEVETFNITVVDTNDAPVISISPPAFFQITSGASQVNIDVNATITDEEGNEVDIIFELSRDNFSSILQTTTYSNIDLSPGVDYIQNHTFSDVGLGEYNWRARAVETGNDVETICPGSPFEIAATPLTSNQPVAEISLAAETSIDGYVFIDSNRNGVFDSGEVPVSAVTVFVTDSEGLQSVESASNGYFLAEVLTGSVTVEVDESDPDIPEGFVSQGPVTITAVLGAVARAELPLVNQLANSGGFSITILVVALITLSLALLATLKLYFSSKSVGKIRG